MRFWHPLLAITIASNVMSDENDKLFTVKLTEDEVDQCTHALSEWYDRLLKDGHTRDMTAMKGFLSTIRKLENVLDVAPIDTDRFAMGTPDVAHAVENTASFDIQSKIDLILSDAQDIYTILCDREVGLGVAQSMIKNINDLSMMIGVDNKEGDL